MGNIQAESAFNPHNLENTANKKLGMTDEQYTNAVDNGSYTNFVRDGFGYGLGQWTFFQRKQMYLNYVKSRGGSIGDCKLQVGFMIYELKTQFVKIFRLLCSSKDLESLTWLVLDEWENPDAKESKRSERYEMAKKIYNEFESKGGSIQMTQNEAIKNVLDLARSEIGYHESGNNITKFAAYLDSISGFYNGQKNGYAWCDVFVDYLFVKCFGANTGREMICQPTQSGGAGCLYSAQYYKDAGRWVTSPQPGDQIFFSYSPGEYSHTGIVESVSGGTVTTIEGNTSDSVARRNYSTSSGSIVGYGRPRWELASDSDGSADDEVIDLGPVDDTSAQSGNIGCSDGILRKGSKGVIVREYQEKLKKLGYDLGKYGADGDFGRDTRAAVIQFQKDHNLKADGEIGPITSAAIEAALGNSDAASVTTASNSTGVSAIKPDSNGTVVIKGETIPGAVQVNPITGRPLTNSTQGEENKQEDQTTTQPKKTRPTTTPELFKFKVGDTVFFNGWGHYLSAIAKIGFACKPGKAVVKAVNKSANAIHPYRVQAVRGGGSNVNGWVDADALQGLQ